MCGLSRPAIPIQTIRSTPGRRPTASSPHAGAQASGGAGRAGALLRAKTATIDGVWSTVGSSNLDWRSALDNNEINAVVLGREFAQQMQAMFDADLAVSDAIDPERWERRP